MQYSTVTYKNALHYKTFVHCKISLFSVFGVIQVSFLREFYEIRIEAAVRRYYVKKAFLITVPESLLQQNSQCTDLLSLYFFRKRFNMLSQQPLTALQIQSFH